VRTAAYWREFHLEAILPGLARELPEYEVIEVLAPLGIGIPIRSKYKTKKGEWKERFATAEYQPGQVLHKEWRAASEWEAEEWAHLSLDGLRELGVFRKGDTFSVQIVEKIQDLPAMARQRSRHIPASKIARRQRSFTIPGDAEMLAGYAQRLTSITQLLLQSRTSQQGDLNSQELSQLTLELEGSRSRLKRLAMQEISFAQQGRFWETSIRTGQATVYLLQERARSYEIALKTLELAEKLLHLMGDIERRFRNCYRRLGQLGEQLDPLLHQAHPDSQRILSIAKEAQGIWIHLTENVPRFNPYCERLQAPQFQRLSRSVEHARQDKAGTLFNDIKEAAAKLEAVALKERPTKAEVARQKAAIG